MIDVHAIPAFRDNYIWLLVGEGTPPPVVIVDPGDAAPVIAALRHLGLRPTTLFITHQHSGHVAYHGGGRLFCGDTLFAGGCGRLFEGTAAQMYASLGRLASLADDTIVYCAHEYTLSNLAFALAVEPENAELRARHHQAQALRRRGEATVPSTMAVEKGTNPFLRCHIPALAAAASRHAGRTISPGVETFVTLRGWKDSWQA